MVGHVEDLPDVRREGGAGAVDFQPDDLPVLAGEVAEFVQRAPDLFERLLVGHLLGEGVRAHLHAGRADVLGQENVFLSRLDVLAQLGLVGRVVIEDAAQAHQLHLGVGKTLPDVLALFLGQVHLDLVGVRGAQLDAFELRRLAVLDDGGYVPIGRQVVGDQSQMHGGAPD